jgi:hypothetical protein
MASRTLCLHSITRMRRSCRAPCARRPHAALGGKPRQPKSDENPTAPRACGEGDGAHNICNALPWRGEGELRDSHRTTLRRLRKTSSFADKSDVFEAAVSPVTIPAREQNQEHARKISRNPWEPVLASKQKGGLTARCPCMGRQSLAGEQQNVPNEPNSSFVFNNAVEKRSQFREDRPAAASPIAPPPGGDAEDQNGGQAAMLGKSEGKSGQPRHICSCPPGGWSYQGRPVGRTPNAGALASEL